jgi:hypothetical protein
MAQIRVGKAESSVERHHERFEAGFRLRALRAPPATPVPPAEEEEEEVEAEVAAVAAVVEAADLLAIEPLALEFASVAPEPPTLAHLQAV